jgi:hypothetical protein
MLKSFLITCLTLVGTAWTHAEIPVQVRSTGFGAVVLAEPLPRAALEKLLADAPKVPEGPAPALWLRWADGTTTALDRDVIRLLPDHLLKVYTMSSTSPLLTPGERSGAATLVALPLAPYGADDWALQPGEPQEKAELVTAFHRRYVSGATAQDLEYYRKPGVLADRSKTKAEKRAARLAVQDRPIPALRPAKARPGRISLPVTLIQNAITPGQGLLTVRPADLTPLARSVQVPLGNYNYDIETISALDKPNELTVAEGEGLDLFALAQKQWGKRAVAAVELMCYNGFTSTITAPGQGLLLSPPDGDFAAALAAGEAIYTSYEEPIIIALRQAGQSPSEAASGVVIINVLLR